MALEPIPVTKAALGNQIAQRLVQEELNIAKRREHIRANGIPAVAAQPAVELPNGQIRPAQPASPALTGAEVDGFLGEANCAAFDTIKEALGI